MKVGKEPRIDLLAYQREEQMQRSGNLKNMAVFAVIFLLLLGGMGFLWWFQNQQAAALQMENRQLQQEIDKLSKSVAGGTAAATDADSRQGILQKLEQEALVKSGQLRQIYQLSIPDITFGKLEMKSNNELAMTAYCSKQASAIKFLGQLRELDFIKDVKDISSKYNEKSGEVTLKMTLVWEVE